MLVLGDQPVVSVLYCRAISAAILPILFPRVRTADRAVVPPFNLPSFIQNYRHVWSPCGSSASSVKCTTYCPELKPLVLLTCVTLPIAAPLSLGFIVVLLV